MRYKPVPRYLRVAHWLLEQRIPLSSREVSDVFGVSAKVISNDFARIRQRPDIIHYREQRLKEKNGMPYLLEVLHIHDYVLDARQYPHLQVQGDTREPRVYIENL